MPYQTTGPTLELVDFAKNDGVLVKNSCAASRAKRRLVRVIVSVLKSRNKLASEREVLERNGSGIQFGVASEAGTRADTADAWNILELLYAGRDGQLADLALFGHVNLARVAEAFGVRGARVDEPQDIIPTIKSALAAGEPFLVDVVTDPDCNPEPPWMPAP